MERREVTLLLRPSQLAQRARGELADAVGWRVEDLRNLVERSAVTALEAEAKAEDLALQRIERLRTGKVWMGASPIESEHTGRGGGGRGAGGRVGGRGGGTSVSERRIRSRSSDDSSADSGCPWAVSGMISTHALASDWRALTKHGASSETSSREEESASRSFDSVIFSERASSRSVGARPSAAWNALRWRRIELTQSFMCTGRRIARE